MTMEIVNTEKISFILYGSYEEQLNMLTDEQAGKLLKSIYVYVRTGEKENSDDPMVNLMLSVIGHQLDIDAQKYVEKKERLREAGRKGGLQKAKNLAAASHATNDLAKASDAKNILANLAVDVYVDEDVDVDDDVDVLDYISGGDEEGEDTRAYAEEVILIFDDQYPTTRQELDKFSALADELFVRYAHKQPTAYDKQQVFENTHSIGVLADDTHIAVLDNAKAELLRYAFQLAANADKVNWGYVNGIYANFGHRGIETVEDAYRYDWERNYGKVSA